MHEALPFFTPVHGAGGAGGHPEEGPPGLTTQFCSPCSAPVTCLLCRAGDTVS